MSEDLDDLLRRTMKTLDDQVPAGYFDALPERVSARLGDGSPGTTVEEEKAMQHGSTSNDSAPTAIPPVGSIPPVITIPAIIPRPQSASVPPVVAAPVAAVAAPVAPAKKRDDDSGLHDIRNLAQSTKQRLSSKRVTTNPPMSDDDVLGSSSASWKNLALPQPAKMVSLPALDELPSKQEIVAQDKAAKAAAKAAAKEARQSGSIGALATPQAPGSVPATAAVVDPALAPSAPTEYRPAFSAFAARQPKPSNRNRNIALVGMGLAAAAGITIFVATQSSSSDKAAAPATARAEETDHKLNSKELDRAADKLEAQRAAAAGAADKNEGMVAGAPSATAPDDGKAMVETKADAKGAHHGMTKTAKPEGKAKDAKEIEKPADAPKAPEKKVKGEPGDPSFDELLKEAGVDQNKKGEKPKLEKKQLSGDDFKKGMSAIQAKAAACYKGTQGTAAVKLTVAPSGQVSKVTVGGLFAGKPEADCVVSAVKSASFPAWDGGPQSFGYPILLSE